MPLGTMATRSLMSCLLSSMRLEGDEAGTCSPGRAASSRLMTLAEVRNRGIRGRPRHPHRVPDFPGRGKPLRVVECRRRKLDQLWLIRVAVSDGGTALPAEAPFHRRRRPIPRKLPGNQFELGERDYKPADRRGATREATASTEANAAGAWGTGHSIANGATQAPAFGNDRLRCHEVVHPSEANDTGDLMPEVGRLSR